MLLSVFTISEWDNLIRKMIATETMNNDEDQYTAYPHDLEEIISTIAIVQEILSQLKTGYQNNIIYKLDYAELRKDNEILKNGLSALEKVVNETLLA